MAPVELQRGEDVSHQATLENLEEADCLHLIAPGGIGRIAYSGRYDLTVLPVNYKFLGGAILFRTAQDGLTVADLRSQIPGGEYRVAFEIDEFDLVTHEGWSVLIQGPAHHVDDAAELAQVLAAGVEPWPGGERDHFIKISPMRITGRRIHQAT
jgi:nitroimidazol reductase NimA-like FMN-containing flavoprotein (pyridoxamine 5'-phosphate oxidase superfamily)